MLQFITRYIRYILPFVFLLLIATYLILSPALHTHAAASLIHHIVANPGSLLPDMLWYGD